MPLKSAELHRLAREELGPLLVSLGFKRTPKTSIASWTRGADGRWLVMWFQHSLRNGVDSAGFRFTIELGLAQEPIIGAGGPRLRLCKVLTNEEREELRQLENRTIAKLPPPNHAFVQMMSPELRDLWLADWKPRVEPYDPQEDVWFRHGDEADARALMAFFRRVLPDAIDTFLARTAASASGPSTT